MIYVALIVIMIAHYAGDFLFQTREMAENKSRSIMVLLDHVFVYTRTLGSIIIGTFIAALLIFPGFLTIFMLPMIGAYMIINGVLHFAVDYVTSKVSAYYFRVDNMKAFWNTIGFDQFLHASCLIGTAALLTL